MKTSLKFFRGNTSTGGTDVPAAEAMAQTVTSSPLSWETNFPICLLPFFAKIFGGLCVVVHPVSSKLKMVHAVDFAFKYQDSRLLKKVSMLNLSKAVVRASDVGSGARRASPSPFRALNPFCQSMLAILFSFQF